MEEFKRKDGSIVKGDMVRFYKGFENDETRYVFIYEGREYRCVKDENGKYKEK